MKILDKNDLRLTITTRGTYLEDLEFIINMCLDKRYTCKIRDKNNQYDNLEELCEIRGEKISYLELLIEKKDDPEYRMESLRITFNSGEVCLSSFSLKESFKVLFHEISDYFNTKLNYFEKILCNLVFILYVILFSLVAAISALFFVTKIPILSLVLAVLSVLGLFLVLLQIALKVRSSDIFLIRKYAKKTFWVKYKDLLLVILGVILGKIIDLVLK